MQVYLHEHVAKPISAALAATMWRVKRQHSHRQKTFEQWLRHL